MNVSTGYATRRWHAPPSPRLGVFHPAPIADYLEGDLVIIQVCPMSYPQLLGISFTLAVLRP